MYRFVGENFTLLALITAVVLLFVAEVSWEVHALNPVNMSGSRRSRRLRDQREKEAELPRLSAGILADIQYAPIPDGFSYAGRPRYYRHALDATRHAAEHFQRERVGLLLNLGDIVDGKCQTEKISGADVDNNPGHQAVDDVLTALSPYSGTVLHAYGNHCLYNLDRPTLKAKLGIPFVEEESGDLVGYHSYCRDGMRFVMIDSYDISMIQRCRDKSTKHKEAHEILSKNNPNLAENENSPEGMTGMSKRFVAFNGGVGKTQLQWLEQTLQEAREADERVVILSHQPLLPGSAKEVCLVWNYKEVIAVLRRYKDVVAASLAGHSHRDCYKRDEKSGIHFRVFEAVLESTSKTYAIADFYNDRIQVRGFGNCTSAVYLLDHQPPRRDCEGESPAL